MVTAALRYFDKFAPECGTIQAHEEVIKEFGYVWYGKLGSAVSLTNIQTILNNEEPKILLIHSGKADRYWAYITDIKRELAEKQCVPEYYRNRTEDFHTWFKVVRFEKADKDVMKRCFVKSSNKPLGDASKHSMSPYFIIQTDNEGEA